MTATLDSGDLQLNIADTLLLQFVTDDTHRKHPAKVIGYLQGKSLLVTTPSIEGRLMLVREGQPLIVRMLSGNNVYAFNTQILATNHKPYAYLHLAYPNEIEKIVVRKAMRVAANLEVTIALVNVADPKLARQVNGRVVDISTAGALVPAKGLSGAGGDLLAITMRVPVAGVQKYVKVPAVIRSVRETAEPEEHQYGVEFQLLEEMDSIILHGFVYEQIQKQSLT